jgi:hypothetical protein
MEIGFDRPTPMELMWCCWAELETLFLKAMDPVQFPVQKKD